MTFRTLPQPGEVWQNTKNKRYYQIVEIATDANNGGTNEPTVVYKGEYKHFTRDLAEFMGYRIDIGNKRAIPRFVRKEPTT